MEHKIQKEETEDWQERGPLKNSYLLPGSILISALILATTWVYPSSVKTINDSQKVSTQGISKTNTQKAPVSELEEKVLPSAGVVLPVTWGDLGTKLVSAGAIDADRFKAIYEERGTFTDEYENILLGKNNGNLKITNENAGYLLNIFWALGLASKNPVLDSGEMVDPRYGGAENFASTGGWTMAKGNAMNHYSQHKYFDLTAEQQALVEKVSKGIYRPCCGNSTHFPDCNHGMAMLGLLELMASQGVSEQEIWKTALAVNSYWFPDTYLTIATYMKGKGVEWKDVSPEEMLGANYSSGQGFAKIRTQVSAPSSSQSGGGCGVDSGAPAPSGRQQSGCGI